MWCGRVSKVFDRFLFLWRRQRQNIVDDDGCERLLRTCWCLWAEDRSRFHRLVFQGVDSSRDDTSDIAAPSNCPHSSTHINHVKPSINVTCSTTTTTTTTATTTNRVTTGATFNFRLISPSPVFHSHYRSGLGLGLTLTLIVTLVKILSLHISQSINSITTLKLQ